MRQWSVGHLYAIPHGQSMTLYCKLGVRAVLDSKKKKNLPASGTLGPPYSASRRVIAVVSTAVT